MKKVILTFLGFIVFLLVGFILFFGFSSQPVSPIKESKVFVVNQGDSLDLIATRLNQAGLVRNVLVFKLNAYLIGLHDKLRAGTFNIPSNLDNQQIVRTLTTGGSHDHWIQIIEGWRNEEIADYFNQNNFYDGKSFLYLAKDSHGYIFPDTYSIPVNKDIDFFIAKASSNFESKYQQASQQSSVSLKKEEVVILASLVEREARTLESKQMVAGILLNRLTLGMALQVDATVQYAVDSLATPDKYWLPISKKDLSISSDYNTYINPGLPPGPICNPGYDSIFAVLNPIGSDYIYYITGNDNKMHYATTIKEHNQNIANFLR